MLLNDYHPHYVPFAKELIQRVRNSNTAYKQVLKQKRESEKKAEKDQMLARLKKKLHS